MSKFRMGQNIQIFSNFDSDASLVCIVNIKLTIFYYFLALKSNFQIGIQR